jgi:hypothetical protein
VKRGAVRGVAVVSAAVAAFAGAGCSGADFSADQSVHITSPQPLALVSVPFRVAWSVSRHSGDRFAVFLDSTPMAPGTTLRQLAGTACKGQVHCPDATYLAGLGIYLTSSNRVTIPALPATAGTNGREPHPVHTLTVVLVNAAGSRVGSAAWETEFRG